MIRPQKTILTTVILTTIGLAPARIHAQELSYSWPSWWNWTLVAAQFVPTTNLTGWEVAAYGAASREALAQKVTVGFSGYIDHVELLLSTKPGEIARAGDLEVVIGSPSGHFSGSLLGTYVDRPLNQELVRFDIRGIGGQRRWVNAGESITIELKNRVAISNAKYLWWGQGGDPYAGGLLGWWLNLGQYSMYYYWFSYYDLGFRVHLS